MILAGPPPSWAPLVGRVADVGDGMRFSAYVEYEASGPFSFMNGPHLVDADEAIGWARAHARRVIVRVGESFYTAGEEPVRDLPPWEPAVGASSGPASPGGELGRWRVEARVGWFRADGAAVARLLADALRAEAEAEDVTHGTTEAGFSVVFELVAASPVEANEAASRVLRAAWTATRTKATPGTDFDVPSMVVRPLQHPLA